MAIPYSLVPITTNPRDKNAKWQIYAKAQRTETLTTRDIAEHLASHNSPFTVGTIIGLLEDAQRCIFEHLQAGARVDLDRLGAFYTTLTSRGADRAEDFTDDNIERINLRWKPSARMAQDIQSTPLKLVANREEQRKAKRKMAEKADEDIAENHIGV